MCCGAVIRRSRRRPGNERRPRPARPAVPDPRARARPLRRGQGAGGEGHEVLRRLPAAADPPPARRDGVRHRRDPGRRVRPHRRHDAAAGQRPVEGRRRRRGGGASPARGGRRSLRRVGRRATRAAERRRPRPGRHRGHDRARDARGGARAARPAHRRGGPQGPHAPRRGGRPACLLAPAGVEAHLHHRRRPGRQPAHGADHPHVLLHGRHADHGRQPARRVRQRRLAGGDGGPAVGRPHRRRQRRRPASGRRAQGDPGVERLPPRADGGAGRAARAARARPSRARARTATCSASASISSGSGPRSTTPSRRWTNRCARSAG